ncbi:MAG: cell division protein ZapA [Pseudomonadota bacterium]
MPEVTIRIGGRGFEVSCQVGEESYLHSAAKMLDDEAQVLSDQIGRMPEARMLLMAGLMLADKTAAVEDRVKVVESQLAEAESELARLRNEPLPEPERVEVAVVPPSITDTLAELAARAEALADNLEEKTQTSTDAA